MGFANILLSEADSPLVTIGMSELINKLSFMRKHAEKCSDIIGV